MSPKDTSSLTVSTIVLSFVLHGVGHADPLTAAGASV
jgi:hypothetical protein